MNRLIYTALIVLGLIQLAKSSADIYVPITRYDVYNGLPENQITHTAQAPDESIWIGSLNGLTQYNAIDLITYKNNTEDPDSMPGNSVSVFAFGGNNDVWLSLNQFGLTHFDRSTQAFTLIGNDGPLPDSVMSPIIFAMITDHNDNVWFFQFETGISVWLSQEKKFIHFQPGIEGSEWLDSTRFFHAIIDDDNQIWVITLDSQVLKIDAESMTATSYKIPGQVEETNENRMFSIAVGADQEVFLSGAPGVFRFNSDTQDFDLMITQKQVESVLGEALSIRYILFDQQRNLWLATTQGLMLYQNNRLHRVFFNERGKSVDSNIRVNQMMQDHEGNIWLSTFRQGVFKISPHWEVLTPYLTDMEQNRNLDNIIFPYMDHSELADTFWWVDDKKNSINVIKYENNQLSFFEKYNEQHLPSQRGNINATFQDKRFLYWIAASDQLYRFNPESQKFENIASEQANLAGIDHIFQQQQEYLYVHAYGEKSLSRIDTYELTAQSLPEVKLHNSMLLGSIHGPDQNIWLFGEVGLESFNTETGESTLLLPKQGRISDVILDQREGQTYVWLLQNNQVGHFLWTDNGLLQQDTSAINTLIPNVSVDYLLLDNRANLWLGGYDGVVRIRLEDLTLERINVTEGLPSNNVLDISQMYDGQIMVLTNKGLARINDNFDLSIEHKAPVVIHQVLLNQSPVTENANTPLQLNHDYGVIAIDYGLLSFTQPETNVYQYQLQPNQNSWIDIGTNTQQNFPDLGTGNYRFQIRGKNQTGNWSEAVSYSFSVLPPPWKSRQAYFIYAISGLLLLLLATWIMRKRWQYSNAIEQANEKRHFAENQLSLTSSLVETVDLNTIFQKITTDIQKKVARSEVHIAYWNQTKNVAYYSDPEMAESDKIKLKAKTNELMGAGGSHQQRLSDGTHQLAILIPNSSERMGLLHLQRQDRPYLSNEISIARAYAAQSSVAIENARLFNEVNELAVQARAASQAKSDFLAQVSHEVRTPMNGILGMNELMMDTQLNEEQQLYSTAIQESGNHLLSIINDILDLSKIEAGQLILEQQEINLLNICDEVSTLFLSQSKNSRILFYTDIHEGLNAHRIGDELRIKQILFNLLSNAFKFTHQGEIVVSLWQDVRDNNTVCCSVRDTGIGIDEALQQSLFEPFSQADSSITRKYGGTGLGLSIVKQLVEKMSGHIELSSQPGLGTHIHFDMKLPRSGQLKSEAMSRQQALMHIQHRGTKQAFSNHCHRLNIDVTEQQPPNNEWNFVVVDALMTSQDKQFSDSAREMITLANKHNKPAFVLCPVFRRIASDDLIFRIIDVPLSHQQLVNIFTMTMQWDDTQSNLPLKENFAENTSQKILVVEDNAINQQLVIEILEKAGHQVDVLDHAEEALQRVQYDHYDVLIADYHLPDTNGLEMILHMRSAGIKIPVIMVTADLSDDVILECHSQGVAAVLGKPFKTQDLLNKLNAIHHGFSQ
ncbi:ATP-binding protein [Marinicella sp. W31]|uniref:hybrid sensor histidine kinase/response regulator n=1 Tax=Marinicella sp. W31 TaxID=3023713 RepID=UPI00375846D0